ncbi:hypothetical protein ABPG72_006840 [Tetrahymena utriculariae]
MINLGQLQSKDFYGLKNREKDDIIEQLIERVEYLQSQKDAYKNLSDNLLFNYQRMKELYNFEQDKCQQLKEDNKNLRNEIYHLKYKLDSQADEEKEILVQQVIDTPLSKNNQGNNQFNLTFTRNPISNTNNYQLNQVSTLNDFNNLQKNQLIRQQSHLSQNSNSAAMNQSIEQKKIIDTNQQEESEAIEFPQSVQKINFQDIETRQQADIDKRYNVKIGDLLFQDFLLIGPSLDELNGKCPIGEGGINKLLMLNNSESQRNSQGLAGQNAKNLNDGEDAYFSQEILFDLVKNKLDEQQQQVISKHPFPFQVKCRKIKLKKAENFPQEIQKIFTENKVQDIKQFVFTIEGEHRADKYTYKEQVNKLVELCNPNKKQYCIYFEWEDFIFTEKDKNTLFKCQFAFCFVTYYPFFSFFREVVCHIISKIQKKRIPLIRVFFDNKQDINQIIEQLQKTYSKNLLDLQLVMPQMLQTIQFVVQEEEDEIESNSTLQAQDDLVDQKNSFNQVKPNIQSENSSKVSYMVPSYQQLRLLETSQNSGSNWIFQMFTFDDFWMILTLVMLEQNICFFSSSIQLVAGALQTFASIYKPFTQCNLPILHIFENNLTYLESPFPFLSGINQNQNYIKQNKIICEDSRSVTFIDLDNRKIHLSEDVIKQFEEENCYMNYTKYIYELRKAYGILQIQPYRQMVTSNFTEFFSHSFKLFNHMVFQSPPIPQSIIQKYKSQQQLSSMIQKNTAMQQEGKNLNLQIKSQQNIPFGSMSSQTQIYQNTDMFNDKGIINYALDKRNMSRLQNDQSEEAKSIYIQYKNSYYAMLKDIKTKALEEFYEYLEKTFQYYILGNLPKDQNLSTNFKDINIQEFRDKMLKKCEEKNFTKLFLKTQTFSYYSQQYYENENQKPTTSSTKATYSQPSTANPLNKF